jgi:hypothetical protein
MAETPERQVNYACPSTRRELDQLVPFPLGNKKPPEGGPKDLYLPQ